MSVAQTFSQLRAEVKVDNSEKTKSDLHGIKQANDGLADSFKKGIGAVSGMIAGFTGFKLVDDAVSFLKDNMADWMKGALQAQTISAETNRILSSQSHVMGITAGQVENLATKYMNLSGVDDDIIHQAENILAGFNRISGQSFPDVTKTALDMARAMSVATGGTIDVTGAARALGMALQDPTKGARLLRAENIILTTEQTKQIATFMKHGEAAKADAYLLGIVKDKVQGAADAYGQTNQGKIDRFHASLDNMGKMIAGTILPVLSDLMDAALPIVQAFGEWLPGALKSAQTALNDFINLPVVKNLEDWSVSIVRKVIPAFGDKGLAGGADTAKAGLKRLSGETNTAGDNLAGPFVKKVQAALNKMDEFTNKVSPPADPKNGGATGATLRFNAALDKMDAQLDKHAAATKKSTQATQDSIPVISGIGDKFREAGQSIGGMVDDINSRLPGAMPQIQRFGTFISNVFQGALPGIQAQWEGFWAFLSMPVRIALESVHTVFNGGLDALRGDWKSMFKDTEAGNNRVQGIFRDGLGGLGRIVTGGWQAVIGGWGAAIGHFPDLLSPEIKAAMNQVGQFMWKEMHEIGNQISAALSDWYDRFRQFWNNLPNFPGKSNLPSRGGGKGNGGGGSAGSFPGRVSGGPVSGPFFGAEDGRAELLVTPGLYNAPIGSRVYNANDTARMLGTGGDTFHITIVGANKTASQLFDEFTAEADYRRRGHGG